ncbi:MAG: hypothetical protein JSU87_15565 [Gemmatimonadota bacterium]|nr:MAG: hypothetical protein JSU87_15565 [Gemmatimonadota bacterium]
MTEDKQALLISKVSAHNTTQLKQFFDGSAIEGDWSLIFAASYNGCIISLPAKGGGQMRLRIAARYRDDQPYLELRCQRIVGTRDNPPEDPQ